MGTKYTRTEVLDRLRNEITAGRPLLAVCTGSGLNAKLAEIGGADMITLVHTGMIRQKGLPSITQLDISTNDTVKSMMADQFAATREIPIICGINVSEFPADGDLGELIDSFMPLGFSGIMNFPTAGEVHSSEFVAVAEAGGMADELKMFDKARENEKKGLGYSREIELIRAAHVKGFFTAVYAFTEEHAAKMAEAGADLIAGHCGGTAGGLVGHSVTASYEDAGKRLQRIIESAKKVNPNVFVLGHGGPFARPEDVVHMYEFCEADGFIAGSAVDRIPIEKAIIDTARALKQ